jgi:hypothetical protein
MRCLYDTNAIAGLLIAKQARIPRPKDSRTITESKKMEPSS